MCSAAMAGGCREPQGTPTPEPVHSAQSTAASAAASSSAAPTATANAAASIDPSAVASATGGKPEVAEGVVKVSFPREDVKIEVDKWSMPPFMGPTSWAAFTPGQKPGV